jgi:hypothetical protein
VTLKRTVVASNVGSVGVCVRSRRTAPASSRGRSGSRDQCTSYTVSRPNTAVTATRHHLQRRAQPNSETCGMLCRAVADTQQFGQRCAHLMMTSHTHSLSLSYTYMHAHAQARYRVEIERKCAHRCNKQLISACRRACSDRRTPACERARSHQTHDSRNKRTRCQMMPTPALLPQVQSYLLSCLHAHVATALLMRVASALLPQHQRAMQSEIP